jgi:hypothetical protein
MRREPVGRDQEMRVAGGHGLGSVLIARAFPP